MWSRTWGEQAAGPVASVPTAGTSNNFRLTSHAMLTSSYGAGNSIFQSPPSLGPQPLSTHRRSQGRESSAVIQRGNVFSGTGRELAERLQGLSAHVCAGGQAAPRCCPPATAGDHDAGISAEELRRAGRGGRRAAHRGPDPQGPQMSCFYRINSNTWEVGDVEIHCQFAKGR